MGAGWHNSSDALTRQKPHNCVCLIDRLRQPGDAVIHVGKVSHGQVDDMQLAPLIYDVWGKGTQ